MSEETFEFEIENRLYEAGLNPFYGKLKEYFTLHRHVMKIKIRENSLRMYGLSICGSYLK